ncbi:MAG: MBL fold metallo-hydrolase [Deltaproteobacteria bacterium]|nr:MBL fold metallo-hydrolase [Deltaproteobacteria bacterium]
MDNVLHLQPDIDVLPSHFPIPGMGFLAVNAFFINAAEPVLVDTGMGMEGEDFMKALKSVIALKDLRWVWITQLTTMLFLTRPPE